MDDRIIQLIILGHICKFALDVKMCIGLAPRQTVEVGRRGKVGRIFFGGMEGQTADKKRSKNFVLGSPHFKMVLSLNQLTWFVLAVV